MFKINKQVNFFNPYNLTTIFIIYSVLGWVYEMILQFIYKIPIENRGFLYGPYLPIYGIGGIVATFLIFKVVLPRLRGSSTIKILLAIFLVITFSSTIIEFVGGLTLDKLLHIKLWDYSQSYKANLMGYVALSTSIRFGLFGTIAAFLIYPGVSRMVIKLGRRYMKYQSLIIGAIMGFDFIASIFTKILNLM